MHRDAKCVYVANSPGEADVVAVWLEEQDFPTRVMNMSTLKRKKQRLHRLSKWNMRGMSKRSKRLASNRR